MKKISFFFCNLLFSFVVFGAETVAQSGVATDEKTFAEIFKSNLRMSQDRIREERSPFEMEFSYASGKIEESRLENDYYQVDFAGQATNMSMVRFYAASEMLTLSDFFISPGVGLAYAFQETMVDAYAKKGGSYRDLVRVQWAPLQVGAKMGYRISSLRSSIYVRAALSYDWISVNGNLDGINQSYWTTGYLAGAGLTLFESDSRDLNAWFGGVTLSAGVSKPLSENDRGFRSNWTELGLRFLL